MYTPPERLGSTETAARLLSALGNPRRLQVMLVLMSGEISVGALAEKVGMGQSALSQHLAKFRALNLVATRRDGQTVYYRCISTAAARLLDALAETYCMENRLLGMSVPEQK